MPANRVKPLVPKHRADLSRLTYFALPGRAANLIETSRPAELVEAVKLTRALKQPYFILAGGSNIVTRGDYPGTVILYRAAKEEGIKIEGRFLAVDASVPLSRVIDLAIDSGLAGLEKMAGIPGTVGGAIYGNAGAYGCSISGLVDRVLIFDGRRERSISNEDCRFAYRDSIFKRKKWLILSVRLKLTAGKREDLRATADRLIKERYQKFTAVKCPGSFFKNVLVSKIDQSALAKIDQAKIIDGKIPAGYLLEAVGAKGMKVGGAVVADYHGNLIYNDGTAKYRDVEKLVNILKEKVRAKFGIKLEEEVRYLI